VFSQAYDLVVNGVEIGGGSIRIHDVDLQYRILNEFLGIPDEKVRNCVGKLFEHDSIYIFLEVHFILFYFIIFYTSDHCAIWPFARCTQVRLSAPWRPCHWVGPIVHDVVRSSVLA
jgi:hypothetical protein